MRVLTVANHLGSRGGLERTQMTNCRCLAERGHEVDVLYVTGGDFEDDWRSFARSMHTMTGSLPRRRAPISSVLGVLRAVSAAARLAPDVVYVYRYWDLPLAAAVARRTGAAVVFHLCLPPPGRIPRWLRPALRRVDRTLSVSRDTASRWVGTGLDAAGVETVLTGVDLERYAPADAEHRAAVRRSEQLPDDAFVVAYLGRIGREKGVDVLVRAFATVVATLPGARLLLVGSPSLGADPADSARYQAELQALAAGLPVTMLPGRKDVVPVLGSVDVAVVPSLWPEPLSRAVMEPLACGVPVVATDVGGNGEILTGWLAQYLVAPSDADALADRLLRLAGWRVVDPELARRCREHAVQALDLRREADAIERALQLAVEARRAARRWRTSSATPRASNG